MKWRLISNICQWNNKHFFLSLLNKTDLTEFKFENTTCSTMLNYFQHWNCAIFCISLTLFLANCCTFYCLLYNCRIAKFLYVVEFWVSDCIKYMYRFVTHWQHCVSISLAISLVDVGVVHEKDCWCF